MFFLRFRPFFSEKAAQFSKSCAYIWSSSPKGSPHSGQNLGGILGILGLPAAFVAFILGNALGLLRSAFGAEFALVHSAAGAGPAHRLFRPLCSTFGAELAAHLGSAGTGPAVTRRCCGRRRLLVLGLLPHLEEGVGVHSPGVLGHAQAHKAHHCAVFVGGGGLHCLCLGADNGRSGHVRVAIYGSFLKLLDGGFILLGGLDGADSHRDNLYAAEPSPLVGEHLVERAAHIVGVARKGAVPDAHVGNLRKSGLESRQKLSLELAVYLASGVAARDVAADIFVEKHRVRKAVAVLAEAADRYIHIKSDVLVDHGQCRRRRRG